MFPEATHLFGLPERVDKFVLKTTENKDPYRLYNLDVFPHSVNEPEGTYGSVPYLTAHTDSYDAAVIWMNAAETWVDIYKHSLESKEGRLTNFLSESGVMEFFIIASVSNGRTNPAHRVQKQLATITGFQMLPPFFSIGFHYCKCNHSLLSHLVDRGTTNISE